MATGNWSPRNENNVAGRIQTPSASAVPPSRYRLKVIAGTPERFSIHLDIRDSREYQVPADGRVTLEVPGSRSRCSVYLFDRIKLRSGANSPTAKAYRERWHTHATGLSAGHLSTTARSRRLPPADNRPDPLAASLNPSDCRARRGQAPAGHGRKRQGSRA